MLFTPVGRTSVSRAVPRNAQLPIVSTVLGMFTSVRAALLAKAPIEAVFCNGAAAYRIYTKYLQPVSGIAAVKLPSTSTANAACRPETLRAVWGEALGPWISK